MSVQLKVYDYLSTKDAISDVMHDYCQGQIEKAEEYDHTYVDLWKEIDTYLQAGGKRIRAYLVVLTYQAYGGLKPGTILPVVAAWELLHACLLMHDDIIDRDFTRHGVLNISGTYKKIYKNSPDPIHFANGAAMLAGDLLMSGAYELLMSAKVNLETQRKIHRLLTDAIFGVAGGEFMDMEIVLKDVARADALKIAHFKTAEYTCEYPMKTGAVLAGAPQSELEKLTKLSNALGVGFQLVDDLLGVFGDETTTGKSTSGDIREKKRTVLLQETYKRLKGADKRQLVAIMDKTGEPRPSEIEIVRNFMQQSGAKQAVKDQIGDLKKQSLSVLDSMEIVPKYKVEYMWLIKKLLDREA